MALLQCRLAVRPVGTEGSGEGWAGWEEGGAGPVGVGAGGGFHC